MSHHQDHGHGTWQLEELLHAFQGLYFLIQQLVRRLEDVFNLLVQEQRGQGAGVSSTPHQHSPQAAG